MKTDRVLLSVSLLFKFSAGKKDKAEEYFPELFAQPYDKVVVEVELFLKRFHYADPVFEIRCNMPE